MCNRVGFSTLKPIKKSQQKKEECSNGIIRPRQIVHKKQFRAVSPAAVGMMIVVTTVVLAVKKCPYGGIQSAFCYFPIYHHEGKIESFHWALEVWLVKAKAEIQINDGGS